MNGKSVSLSLGPFAFELVVTVVVLCVDFVKMYVIKWFEFKYPSLHISYIMDSAFWPLDGTKSYTLDRVNCCLSSWE